MQKIALGGECNEWIGIKGAVENGEEFIDGDGGVFEHCEGAKSDARVEESAGCFWREYHSYEMLGEFSLI